MTVLIALESPRDLAAPSGAPASILSQSALRMAASGCLPPTLRVLVTRSDAHDRGLLDRARHWLSRGAVRSAPAVRGGDAQLAVLAKQRALVGGNGIYADWWQAQLQAAFTQQAFNTLVVHHALLPASEFFCWSRGIRLVPAGEASAPHLLFDGVWVGSPAPAAPPPGTPPVDYLFPLGRLYAPLRTRHAAQFMQPSSGRRVVVTLGRQDDPEMLALGQRGAMTDSAERLETLRQQTGAANVFILTDPSARRHAPSWADQQTARQHTRGDPRMTWLDDVADLWEQVRILSQATEVAPLSAQGLGAAILLGRPVLPTGMTLPEVPDFDYGQPAATAACRLRQCWRQLQFAFEPSWLLQASAPEGADIPGLLAQAWQAPQDPTPTQGGPKGWQRKWAKLRRDPEQFFKDVRNPVIELLRGLRSS